MKELFSQTGLYDLEMTPEQTDYLWFLDQCGFDQHVRALRHTDVFDRVRSVLIHAQHDQVVTLEKHIHENFMLSSWYLEQKYGHLAAQRHFKRFWNDDLNVYQKSNLINAKLRQIEAGAEPVVPLSSLTLLSSVKDIGSKRALFLMLMLPNGALVSYTEWAQNTCFIDQLLELRPGYSLLEKIQTEYHQRFLTIYRSELRDAKRIDNLKNDVSDASLFYKKLFKFQYPVKRDIVQCLCEANLNS